MFIHYYIVEVNWNVECDECGTFRQLLRYKSTLSIDDLPDLINKMYKDNECKWTVALIEEVNILTTKYWSADTDSDDESRYIWEDLNELLNL